MTQPETRVQRAMQAAIKAQGWFVFKVHGSEFMMAGLPDLIVCAEGIFVGLEAKMPGEKPKPRQEYTHSLIRDAGGHVETVYTPEQAVEAVHTALRKAKRKKK